MPKLVRSVNADEIIREIQGSKDNNHPRLMRWLRFAGNSIIKGSTRRRLFRLLYTDRGEFLLKAWTVFSILAVCLVLVYETWSPGSTKPQYVYLFDSIVFGLLLVETAARFIRLEMLPSFARVIVGGYGAMSEDDVRRFQVLKVILFRLDLILLVTLATFLLGLLPVDPLYASLLRLLRLVAILRAFDIPLMRDLTAVILSAFESVSLILIALGMHVFVYAVVGTVLFGAIAPEYFGNLLTTTNTLLYPLVNKGDSPAMKALCKECGENTVVQILYFSTFLWIGGVILLGLLTRLAKEKVALFRSSGATT